MPHETTSQREEGFKDEKQVTLPGGEPMRVTQYGATLVANIFHLIYGLSIGWSAIALPTLMDEDEESDSSATGAINGTCGNVRAGSEGRLTITLSQGSWLTAALYISATPVAPLYSYVSERFGRKICGYLIGIPFVISAVMLALADSFAVILVSRIVLGIASGAIFVFTPLYVSEIAEDAIRGRLGSFVTLIRNIGLLLAYAFGMFLTYKQFEYVAIVPPLLFLIFFYWMPESPMYLLRQNKVEDAEKALRWLRGSRTDVSGELEKMKESLTVMKSEDAQTATVRDLLATHGSRKALVMGLLMCCDQQLCGFVGILSYTFIIFGEASPDLEDVSNVIVGAMSVLGIAGGTLICDKVPRKVLLLVSNIVMIVSLLLLSLYFFFKDHDYDVSQFGWLPVTAMSFYVVGYNAGLAALPIVILTETFSPKIRNIGLTINGMFSWLLIFVVTITFTNMTDSLGFYGVCWFYIGWCIVGILTIVFMLPETRNRPLESILDELEYGRKKFKEMELSKHA